MRKNQGDTPLYSGLCEMAERKPVSLHVPGHKYGALFPEKAKEYFQDILKIDATEITGMDDLHAPTGMIQEAETLAAELFNAQRSFFLVGGSTAGNLAMILATCGRDDVVLVQRNSHKSIMNGLELAGARPVFMAPTFDDTVERYTHPSIAALKRAIQAYPKAKALILTYPDYFGYTYDLEEVIQLSQAAGIPVLVDEAHGVHFPFNEGFPKSALEYGADVVVHSVHKMAPAMTMGSMLHMQSELVSEDRVAYFLQMIQSSSPSYPLMASLDLARYYLARLDKTDYEQILHMIEEVREIFGELEAVRVLPEGSEVDPLKITLHVKAGYQTADIVRHLEESNVYIELSTERQILVVLGLGSFIDREKLEKAVKTVNERLKIVRNHATIEETKLFTNEMIQLALSYEQMNRFNVEEKSLHDSVGHIAAEAVIPYPPGIPLILKGEEIKREQIKQLEYLLSQNVTLQQRHETDRIRVFCE